MRMRISVGGFLECHVAFLVSVLAVARSAYWGCALADVWVILG